MKPEYKVQIKEVIKLLWVVGFAILYALGGIEHKWLRRFIGPVWLTSGMFIFSRDWRVFLQAPLLMFGLSLGYGAEAVWLKVIKRFIYGLVNGASSITHLFNKEFNKVRFWVMFSLHVFLCSAVVIILGVFNPVSARAEELIIGFTIGMLPMYMPTERKDN
jgi:hypothetical protein